MTSWNPWDATAMPASAPWTNWDPTRAPIPSTGQGGDSVAPNFNLDADWLKTLGYTGSPLANNGNNTDSQAQGDVTSPELMNWLKSNGYNLQLNSSDENHGSKFLGRLVDAQGNQVGQGQQWGDINSDAFGLMALASGGFAGAAAMGAGAAGAGADVGGSGIGADSAAYGSLENGAAYGGGYGDSLVAGPGGASAGGDGALGMGAGYTVPGAGGAAGGAGGAAGAGGGGLFGTGISLGDVAGAVKTYGPLVGAVGGLLGSGSGLNSATQTTQNKVDPRIAQYIYGPDGNSGLLGGVNQLYQQQMATGGLNPLQQQGIAQQQAVLQNPNYAQGFDAMKSAGMGLLSQPIAANPFSTGQRTLAPQSPQSLMQAGQAYVPNRMTTQPVGLLGRS